ncbi:MAG: hypothetical protein HQM03_14995 [Magnetococcales bacterium]|nr:hypothetical protein [Magnetococcales bacterium]
MNDWQSGFDQLQSACLATFGVPMVYTPSMEIRMELGGVPVALTGIFDDRLEEVAIMGDGGAGMPAVIPRQTIEIRVADLGFDPVSGDEVAIDGVAYRIQDVRPNGAGMAVLHLARRQNPFPGF